MLFKNQTVDDLIETIKKFETMNFDKEVIRNHAMEFDEEEFRKQIVEFVKEKFEEKIRMEEI